MRVTLCFSALLAVAISAPILDTALPAQVDVSSLVDEVEGTVTDLTGSISKRLELPALGDLSDLTDLTELPALSDLSDVSDLTDLNSVTELVEVPELDSVTDLIPSKRLVLPVIGSVTEIPDLDLSEVESTVPDLGLSKRLLGLDLDLVNQLDGYLSQVLDLATGLDTDLTSILDAADTVDVSDIIHEVEQVVNEILAIVQNIVQHNTGVSLAELNPTLNVVNGAVNKVTDEIDSLTESGKVGDEVDTIRDTLEQITALIEGLL